MPKPPLTASKTKWAESRPGVVLRGKRLNYNASQQLRYQKALLTLVRQMAKETKDQVRALFESQVAEKYIKQQKQAAVMDASITNKANTLLKKLVSKFDDLFSLVAPKLAEQMVEGATQVSKTTLHTSLKELSGGLSLKTGVVPKGMEDVSNAIINENVSLIKSIPQEYLKNVSGAVMRSITTGAGVSTLIPEIQKYSGQSERHVKNIALDQTRKAYNSINKQRMQAVGVKQFEWVHSGGGQVPRQSHIAMNGKIYSFDDLPVINQEQVSRGYEGPVKGIPGQAINCRCTMVPVIQFDEEE